jgi:hypothetical protein
MDERLVRYRYDEDQRERLRALEPVVERCSRNPRQSAMDLGTSVARPGAPRSVALRITRRKRDLRWRVESAGGCWDPGWESGSFGATPSSVSAYCTGSTVEVSRYGNLVVRFRNPGGGHI